MMKRFSKGHFLILLVALLPPLNTWAKDQRITFKKGAIQAEVTGHLSGSGEVCYRAKARAGQHMKVSVQGDGPTRGTVAAPSGEGEGQPGGMIFDEDLKETGDYRICVEESQMGNRWKGKFVLTLVIK